MGQTQLSLQGQQAVHSSEGLSICTAVIRGGAVYSDECVGDQGEGVQMQNVVIVGGVALIRGAVAMHCIAIIRGSAVYLMEWMSV